MEASALDTAPALRGPTTLLRLQSDERLVTLTRRGNHGAYEVLVQRYQSRLLAFCRHMLGSREDAEDVLQEVFANAFNAIIGDERAINVRPWLYRIARNRSLNHLRRIQPIGVDTLDDRMADHGVSAADTAHRREEFRELLGDVRSLPETQRSALLLREIDALSYDQIAEAMDTTVPSVKSLLVRARVSLAEASEARNLTCEEARAELGEVAESLRRLSPPVRRHVKECERCAAFQTHLKANNRAMQAIFPLGPLVLAKKLLAHVTAGAGASGGAAASGAAAGAATSSVVTAGLGSLATKTAAGLAAAALFTAGAVEVDNARSTGRAQLDAAPVSAAAPTAPAPPSVHSSGAARPGPAPAPAKPSPATTARTTTTRTTTSTGSTTTAASKSKPTTTAPKPTTATSPATTAPSPVSPATPSAPADTGQQTVTLPTTTAPKGTTTGGGGPSTTTSTSPAPPPPSPTPGADGQLPAPKLGSGAKPRVHRARPPGRAAGSHASLTVVGPVSRATLRRLARLRSSGR